MEFRDIEYFAVLAEHGNVGRAAEALGLSPPALSVSLRRLETAMQVKLFHRTPKGVELTAAGAALLGHVERLRRVREDVLREAADLSEGRAGHLHVGAGPATCIALLPLACEQLLREIPAVTVKIAVGMSPPLLEALRNGESDLAVIPLPMTPHDDLVQEVLYDDEMVVYCSRQHRLAKKGKRVTLAEISQEEWASPQTGLPSSELLNRVLREHGFPARKVRVEAGSHQIINHVIATSNLLGFNARFVIRQATPRYRFAELHIAELAHIQRHGLLYRKDGYLSPACRRFMEILKRTAKKLSAAA